MTHAADGVDTTVEIEDAALKRRLARIASRETALALNRKIGEGVLELVKDHLAEMSVTRHKVADRLGAPHSRLTTTTAAMPISMLPAREKSSSQRIFFFSTSQVIIAMDRALTPTATRGRVLSKRVTPSLAGRPMRPQIQVAT